MKFEKKQSNKRHNLLNSTFKPVFFLLVLTMIFLVCKRKPESAKIIEDYIIELTPVQELGKKLFYDRNLSSPPGQACVDCHSPEAGFANPNSFLPVSQGVHKDRFGNRNDLVAAYAAFSPEFHFDTIENVYVGGLFWDGRAADLVQQAKKSFLSPLKMANPDKQTLIDKIRNSNYSDLFKEIFGIDALENTENAFNMVAEAIAEYEISEELNQFSSKYDLFLQGQVELTEQELRGFVLFQAEDKGNCAACHPNQPGPDGTPPLFTDYTYANLGVPKNAENPFYYLPEEFNPDGINYVDPGLGGIVNKQEEIGKFKVPTLRNVAITGPYMHNGIFKTMRQVVSFYNTRDIRPWPLPEIPDNVNHNKLGNLGLTEQEIDDIVAFLFTLTDGYIPDNNKVK